MLANIKMRTQILWKNYQKDKILFWVMTGTSTSRGKISNMSKPSVVIKHCKDFHTVWLETTGDSPTLLETVQAFQFVNDRYSENADSFLEHRLWYTYSARQLKMASLKVWSWRAHLLWEKISTEQRSLEEIWSWKLLVLELYYYSVQSPGYCSSCSLCSWPYTNV